MIERYGDGRGLTIIDVSLSYHSARVHIVFDVLLRGEHRARLQTTAQEIGLPVTWEEAQAIQSNPEAYRLPDHLIAALESLVGEDGDGWPLWLYFGGSSGYLSVVPWEKILQPHLNVALLRLPSHEVEPVVPEESLDTVICLGLPVTKAALNPRDLVGRFLAQLPGSVAPHTTFHLFGDASVQDLLHSMKRDLSREYAVHIYDPNRAPKPHDDETVAAVCHAADNSWLAWMREALENRSVDVVHFLCHGYLGRDQGALALTEAPGVNQDMSSAQFVHAGQLCKFLNRVGAWSVAFSSPPGNRSVAGLRMLQDDVARLRPGPVLFHDAAHVDGHKGLEAAYRFLYGDEHTESRRPPRSPAISLYCHPSYLVPDVPSAKPARQRFGAWPDLIDKLTLAGKLGKTLVGPENTPVWLAAAQRSLEQSVSRILNPTTERDRAIRTGSAEALRFVAAVLARHAKAASVDATATKTPPVERDEGKGP